VTGAGGWSRRRRQGKEREAAGSGGVVHGGGEVEAGKIFCGADHEKKAGEANGEAQEAAADGVGARSCF